MVCLWNKGFCAHFWWVSGGLNFGSEQTAPWRNKTIVICANSACTGCFLKLDSEESDDSDAFGESGDFGECVFF